MHSLIHSFVWRVGTSPRCLVHALCMLTKSEWQKCAKSDSSIPKNLSVSFYWKWRALNAQTYLLWIYCVIASFELISFAHCSSAFHKVETMAVHFWCVRNVHCILEWENMKTATVKRKYNARQAYTADEQTSRRTRTRTQRTQKIVFLVHISIEWEIQIDSQESATETE